MSERWPDLAVVELLVVIDAVGSVSAAARTIGMAQPNASRALRQFERAHGIRLLDRSARGSTLTLQGASLVEAARSTVSSIRSFNAAIDKLRSEHHTNLSVTASMTVAEYLIPAWLSLLRRRRPDVSVSLQVHNSEEVIQLISDGSCEVGFIETPTIPRGIRSTVVATDRLAIVVDPQHPWARRRSITIDELVETPLVVRERGSGTRRTLDSALNGRRVADPVLELKSNSAVTISVMAGAGPAVLSELAVARWIAAGDLTSVSVEGIELERRLRAVWKGPNPLEGNGAELVGIARAHSQATSN